MKTNKVLIVQQVIKETERGLLSFHPSPFNNHEGITYWAGYRMNDIAIVTACIVPKATSGPQEVHTSQQANAEVVSILNKHGLVMIGQVHSHPGNLKYHSEGDDLFAFMPYNDYLSVVVPQYARRGMTPLPSCGFHIFENGSFKVMPDTWTNQNVKVIPNYIDLRGENNGLSFFRR